MQQLDLFDNAPARPREAAGKPLPHKLLLMLKPPAEKALRLARMGQRLRTRHALRGHPMPAPRLHITLQLVGVVEGPPPARVLEAAQAALAPVQQQPIPIAFDHAQSFAGSHAFVLHGGDDAPIRQLSQQLGAALRRRHLPAHAGGTPHMTLLYGGDHDVPDEEVPAIPWTADEVLLVLSPQGLGQHWVLARRALGA